MSTLSFYLSTLQMSGSPRGVCTEDLTSAFGWTSSDAFLQQDAQEMMHKLLEKLEERIAGAC